LQNKDNGAGLLDFDDKLLLQVSCEPGDVDSGPLLGDSPGIIKQTRSIQVGKGAEHVGVRHPEDAVVFEAIVEFGELPVSDNPA